MTHMKVWKKQNPEKFREQRRKYRQRYRQRNKTNALARQHRQISRTMEVWLNRCLRNRRSHDRKIGREFDIDLAYVLEVLEAQNDKCAITGLEMTHIPHNLQAASIDRIDSAKGHLRGNIQIVQLWINLAKGNRPNSQIIEVIAALKKATSLDLLAKLKKRGLLN